MDQPPQVQPPKTFYLRSLLMWPVIFAIIVHNLFPNHLPSQVYTNFSQWTKLLFCYLISLIAFPLLAAIVFTPIASLKRLFITHLWVSVAIVLYNAAYLGCMAILDPIPEMDPTQILVQLHAIFVSVFLLHTDDVSLWRLATLPEPDYGAVTAMEKSYLVLCGVNGVFFTHMIRVLFVLFRNLNFKS
ncbi:hypothetical protein RHSIM_RhsimUnG0225900 [Rhododendron simsii]|uniref:Uncharacterized protein n=1 Tax=Rhododendron simsii TaxID=118357 RepID=A0A834FTH7_RHOSS|nr:hypothetical protein RHSIM_RhsimUnG0225900 [Rhododendron simsii]